MRILIDINHPADVYQFKNMINILQKKGHKFKIVSRKKEFSLDLLRSFGFSFITRPSYNGIKKIFGLIKINWILYKIAKRFKPDIMIGGPGDCYVSQVGFLMRKKSLIFDDTEFSTFQNLLTFPFATKIITPDSFWLSLGKKQVRYDGYHELAYLDPKYFKPRKSIVRESGIDPDEKYVILRMVSWQASHDVNKRGIDNLDKMISQLEQYAKVYITSEVNLPIRFKKYQLNISPENIHHVLYYANMLIGESSTMASEAAVLGTPALFISNSQRGYTKDQEEKYGLVYYFEDEKKMMKKASLLIKDPNLKLKWEKKRDDMLKDKIDVTNWMVKYIESIK